MSKENCCKTDPSESDSDGSQNSVKELITVTKVLDQRVKAGKVEYLLKIRGREDFVWIPADELTCPKAIAKFKQQCQEKKDYEDGASAVKKKRASELTEKEDKILSSGNEKATTSKDAAKSKLTGFDRNLTPDKIVGATMSSGEIWLKMKWQDSEEVELVPAAVAKAKCPIVVIRFYEKHLKL